MTTHNVTFSRDNLIQLVLRPDFYEKNTDLGALRDELKACIDAYRDSGRKAGCGCRADVTLLFGCMDHLLTTLDGWKETAPENIAAFVKYATKITPSETERVTLSIYFRKSGDESDVKRYEFTCP